MTDSNMDSDSSLMTSNCEAPILGARAENRRKDFLGGLLMLPLSLASSPFPHLGSLSWCPTADGDSSMLAVKEEIIFLGSGITDEN